MTATTRNATLSLRALEARDVPSITLTGDTMTIVGTDGHDTVTVRYRTDLELVEATVTTRAANGAKAGMETQAFSAELVRHITFFGHRGNDTFQNEVRLPVGGSVTGNGGDGNDSLWSVDPVAAGERVAVVLLGGRGNDRLFGSVGFDHLDGGDGFDVLVGRDGNDLLVGGPGNDLLRGDRGTDSLYGQDGTDVLYGGDDTDFLVGGAGQDGLFAGGGNDWLWGDDPDAPAVAGADWLDGGDGDDQMFGAGGNDLMYGGRGADYLDAGAGNDRVDGGIDDARDVIVLGAGRDTLVSHRFGRPAMWADYPDDVRDFNAREDRVDYRYHAL